MKEARLPDEAIVVHGGNSTPENVAMSISMHPIGISGLAAVSAAEKTVLELARTVPHRTIRTSTVGDIRRAGGDVVSAEGKSPFHVIITGWRSVYNLSRDEQEGDQLGPLAAGMGEPVRLFADFNNADRRGRVRLNTKGTEHCIAAQHLVLSEGLPVLLSDSDEIEIVSVVRYCPVEGWVAEIDWGKVECE